jgi:hypothetical protein
VWSLASDVSREGAPAQQRAAGGDEALYAAPLLQVAAGGEAIFIRPLFVIRQIPYTVERPAGK